MTQRASKQRRTTRIFPPSLWYENKRGDRWIPRNALATPPRGYIYQHFRSPMRLAHSVTKKGVGEIMRGESSINEELVMAMIGYMPKAGRLKLSAAMMLVGVACERCRNAMAHRAGLKWGYPKGSKQYMESKTRCEVCK